MVKRFVSFVLVVIAFMSYSTVGQAATYQKGDVNKDGAINITDVTLIQMYMAGESIKNFTLYNADFNGDGSITINDISTIQLYMCGHISLYNNYFYTLANGKATITGYNGSTKKLNIPSYLYSDKNVAFRVTTIGENAFYKKYFITEVIIPESVKPMPTQAARIIRGIRSIQTTSTRSLLISVAAKSPAFINNISTISVHAKEIKPNFKPKIIMQSMVRNSNSRRYFTFIFFICAVIAKFIIYT